MKLKSILSILTLALAVTSCSTLNKLVYRIDVPQGNYLDIDKIAQLEKGMTMEQVQYLLGSPLLVDPFGRNTWFYIQRIQEGNKDPIQHKLEVQFDQKGIVTSFLLDDYLSEQMREYRALPAEQAVQPEPEQVLHNEALPETGANDEAEMESLELEAQDMPVEKKWWQFWK